MARRTKREPKPAKSNRGRLDARGVFIVFEPVEDEPLARDVSGGDKTERPLLDRIEEGLTSAEPK
jgi:hypothetical protein